MLFVVVVVFLFLLNSVEYIHLMQQSDTETLFRWVVQWPVYRGYSPSAAVAGSIPGLQDFATSLPHSLFVLPVNKRPVEP